MLCPNCKKEIADGTQMCPECGTMLVRQAPVKQKKPITKKWWFWVIIAVVAIALISSIGGSDSSDTPADSGNVAQGEDLQTTKEETTTSRNTSFSVGDTLNDGKLAITYVAVEEWKDYGMYSEPQSGNKIIRLKFDVVNNGDTDAVLDMFDCYADDVAAEDYYSGDERLETFITLSAGRKTSGWVYFEVPENAQTIEVEYEVNMWSDEKAVFVVDLK